jgi:peroxiredoxin
MSRLKAALAFTVLAAAAVLFLGHYLMAVQASTKGEQAAACSVLRGQPMQAEVPSFSLKDLDGKQHSLDELRGKVVLLNFWFTGCPPCIEELPSLIELRRRFADRPFALLTVSVDETADDVRQFLKKHKVAERDLPILLDPEKKVASVFGTSKYPESFLIDAKGVARQKFVYKRDWASPTSLTCIGSLMR